MPKDDLANLRLDLAPKLNHPLSLSKPLDYLRVLFWVFYFPQALWWYVEQFGSGYPPNMNWPKGLRILKKDSIERKLFFQGLLLIIAAPTPLSILLAIQVNQINLTRVLVGVAIGFVLCVLISAVERVPEGIAIGLSTSVAIGASGNVSPGLVTGIALSIALTISFSGLIKAMINGLLLSVMPVILVVLLTLIFIYGLPGHPLIKLDYFEIVYRESLIFGASLIIGFLRPDSWIISSLATRFWPEKLFLFAGSITIIPISPSIDFIRKSVSGDWKFAIDNTKEILSYTYQFIPTVNALKKVLTDLPESQILKVVAYMSESLSDWNLIKYSSLKTPSLLILAFDDYSIGYNFLALNTPYNAAVAGFWYLYEKEAALAAQAFAVIRDLPYGEEIYELASLLALFNAAETAYKIAAIDPPDLPEERTLRLSTWEVIRRFYRVIAETKVAQRNLSYTTRAFAINRVLGELQHILEYRDKLPEAERRLILEIAKTWQEAVLGITAEVGEAAITQPVQNPYVIGDPVEGELFVGRNDIIRQLQELWLMGNHLQSVVIYGHRRMGKTSIIKNMSQALGAELQVAYVNLLKSAGAEKLSDVLLSISDQVAVTLAIPPPSDADMMASPALNFERFLRRATDSLAEGEGLIIALDEFEKIEELIEAGKLEASFMAYLRGLVQDSPKVGFAFAGLHTLEEMSADYFQPFFASVIPIKVDFFKPATVQTLLPNPGGDFPLDYDYDALDLIYALTAGQPYLTQLLGFQLVRRYNDQVFEQQQKRDPKFTIADVQAVVERPEFFAQGKPYFAGVWAQANHDAPGQQTLLKTLSPHPEGLELDDLQNRSELDQATFAAALETLENHDVVRVTNGTAKIIVEVFRRWVTQQAV